jgi:RNA polymerase sigma factor (sigma-70 family)
MASAPGLVRYAARFTRSLPDAEDAYQRSMEIALTRAPVTEPRRFTAWLHTVIKHEALAIAAARRREAPGAEDDVAASLGDVGGAPPPDALMEWRERYRILQDAVASLTESQRVCLMLKSVGANYAEIATVTGFSLRKVERSILEGRAGLHAWEARMASGGECERLRPALEQAATGTAARRDSRAVSRHVRHCHPCRALLRAQRQSFQGLAALVPPALLVGQVVHVASPDPSHVLGWWERVSGTMTVRAGAAWQNVLDLQGAALAKVGAGTAAVAVAGAAGGPYVAHALRDQTPVGAQPVAITRHVPATRAAAPPGTLVRPPRSRPKRSRHAAAKVRPAARRPSVVAPTRRTSAEVAPRTSAAAPVVPSPASTATTYVPASTGAAPASHASAPPVRHASPRPATATTPRSSPALEFGP